MRLSIFCSPILLEYVRKGLHSYSTKKKKKVYTLYLIDFLFSRIILKFVWILKGICATFCDHVLLIDFYISLSL
jgi:hypothetical protein